MGRGGRAFVPWVDWHEQALPFFEVTRHCFFKGDYRENRLGGQTKNKMVKYV